MIYGFDMKLENWVLKTGSSVTPIQYVLVSFQKRLLPEVCSLELLNSGIFRQGYIVYYWGVRFLYCLTKLVKHNLSINEGVSPIEARNIEGFQCNF